MVDDLPRPPQVPGLHRLELLEVVRLLRHALSGSLCVKILLQGAGGRHSLTFIAMCYSSWVSGIIPNTAENWNIPP